MTASESDDHRAIVALSPWQRNVVRVAIKTIMQLCTMILSALGLDQDG